MKLQKLFLTKAKAGTLALIMLVTCFLTCLPIGSAYAYPVLKGTGNIVYGDVNGDGETDSLDAALMLKYDAGMNDLTDDQFIAADVNGDKEVDALDAALILKYDAGMIDSFPIENASPEIIVKSATVKAGAKSVSVDIEILNNPGISSLRMNVSFGSGLTLTGVAFDPAFGVYVTAPEPFANPQAISLISPLEDIKVSGKFATLTFAVDGTLTAGKKADISISIDKTNTFNSEFTEVTFKTTNGSVTVS